MWGVMCLSVNEMNYSFENKYQYNNNDNNVYLSKSTTPRFVARPRSLACINGSDKGVFWAHNTNAVSRSPCPVVFSNSLTLSERLTVFINVHRVLTGIPTPLLSLASV